MLAFAVTPRTPRSARQVDVELGPPRPDEYEVRVLEVGIDATDKEIDAGEYGEAPAGSDILVLGHEAVGVIARECDATDDLHVGDLVVPTVRRPCPQRCPPCRAGQYDFCASGKYLERGIRQAHGFLAESFFERSEFLLRVPPDLRTHAVLLEPLSIVEKVFRQAQRIQERLLWRPQRVVVAGAGSIGMLAAMLARRRGLDTMIYSKGPATGVVALIHTAIGTEYVNAEERSLVDACARFGAPDLIIEATGYSPLAWDAAQCLAVNGVLCLLSVTGGDRTAMIASDRINLDMVLGNRLVFGSVSSHRLDFENGVDDLRALQSRYPAALDAFISRRIPFTAVREALDENETGILKLVVCVGDD